MSIRLTGGEAWAVVDDPDARACIQAAVDAEYAAFRPAAAALPPRGQAYDARQSFLRLVPDARILSWDNSRLGISR